MSDTLFDISPAEDAPKRKRKQRPAPVAVAEEPTFRVPPPDHPETAAYIGKVDGIPCADELCGCSCHDITQTGMAVLGGDRKEPAWRVECFVCGTGQWIAPVDGRFDAVEEPEPTFQPAVEEFTFDEGAFSGMTPAAVYAQYGRDALEMLANDRRHPSWREPCRTHLDRLAAAT